MLSKFCNCLEFPMFGYTLSLSYYDYLFTTEANLSRGFLNCYNHQDLFLLLSGIPNVWPYYEPILLQLFVNHRSSLVERLSKLLQTPRFIFAADWNSQCLAILWAHLTVIIFSPPKVAWSRGFLNCYNHQDLFSLLPRIPNVWRYSEPILLDWIGIFD